MKISTKGRYGTKALLDLALHHSEGPVPIREIARRQGIPVHYLERLLTPLISARLIGSIRGARGGLKLLRYPKDIRLIDVVRLLEGPLSPVECLNNPENCPRADTCVTRDVWEEVKKAIDSVLEATTLQDLVERQKKKEQAQPQKAMYFI
jgi:Rrf2 family cysteine metabolism transcriptional repressor